MAIINATNLYTARKKSHLALSESMLVAVSTSVSTFHRQCLCYFRQYTILWLPTVL